MLFPLFVSSIVIQSAAVPHQAIDPAPQPSEIFLRVDTPTWSGEFDLHLVDLAQDQAVMVSLTGTINDAHLGKAYTQKASITFVYPVDHNTVVDAEAGRIVRNSNETEVFKVEDLAPNTELWSSVRMPQLGTLEIWKNEKKPTGFSDSIIVSLFDDLVATDETSLNIQGVECNPTWSQCQDGAKYLCDPNPVGTVSYSCSEGTASCNVTCLSSPPG